MEPGIEEATYGNNAFTNIGWITTCLDAGTKINGHIPCIVL